MLDYKIALYIKGIYDLEFHETEISLGTQTRETLDKSYDGSSLEILLTDIKEEFQPYTEALLYIYTEDDKGKVKDAIYHHLMIEGDELVDVYIGENTKYNHRLTLIEATKILETELMPNITFTQPVKNITLGLEYALEMETVEKPTLAVNGVGMSGGIQALILIGATLGGAAAGMAAGVAIGAAIGTSVGPWGTLIGAAAGLVIGAIIDIVNVIKNQDARLLRDFINALDIKHNVPDEVSALIVHGAKVPEVSVSISVDGVLDKINRYFGEGGVWQAIGMLLSIYNTIQSIIKWFAWLFDTDDTISFKIPPASILLVNTDTSQYWNLGTATEITKESDAATLGFTLAKIKYYGITETPKYPEVPEGNYSLLYTFLVDELWVRDFENWPFDMHWNSMGLNETINLDGVSTTLGQIINGCSIVSYQNLYFDTALSNLANGKIQAEYSTQPIYMDELLTRLEDQMTCRDSVPVVKLTPKWTEGLMYDLSTGAEKAQTNSYISKRRRFSRPSKTLGLTAIFSEVDKKYTNASRYNKAKLKANIDVLFLDSSDNYIALYQDEVVVEHEKQRFQVNSVIPVPPGAKGYKANIRLSKPAVYETIEGVKVDVNELDLNKIDFFNTNIKEEKYRPAKYTFSDRARTLSHIVCPEFTFEGKTLWEICLEIGELFHGIPVLREGNIIDYHIVDDNAKKTINFKKEAEKKVVNMTNYATKLYTPELKGIVQDDIAAEEGAYCTYPYPGGWIKVRAPEYDTTVIDRKTSAVVIEGENTGIYKLKEVWCRCPVLTIEKGQEKAIAYREFNITNYVLEKNIYDTLSEELDVSFGVGASTSEKGNFAYYIQGENAIYNLAQLPDNASVLGWKQTHLTIQFILKRQFDLSFKKGDEIYSSDNIFDYEFRVKYVPKHSRLNISRQTNLSNIGYQITSNFNQNSNTVSSTAFSKFADNTLNRLGNPEILTSYTTTELIDGINVGDCLELNGRNYYVNSKVNTYNNSDKNVQLTLTRDNYKQNDRIAVSREYRQYNINSNDQLRKTLSKPFTVILSDQPIQIKEGSDYIRNYSSKNKQLIARSLRETFDRGTYSSFERLTNAFISFYDGNNNPLKYNQIILNRAPTRVVNKVVPVIGECLGNTITLQWDLYDNFSAGRKIKSSMANTLAWIESMETVVYSRPKGATSSQTTSIIEGDYGIKIQDDCRYCDDMGGCPRIYTSFFSVGKNTSLGDTYPLLAPDTVYSKASLTNSVAENELALNLIVDKDSREKLSFQTTISAQTFDKDIDIYSLMKVNPLITELKYKSAKWYGYTKYNQPTDSGLYIPNPVYELKSEIQGPLETKGDAYVQHNIKNNTGTDFMGYILVAQYGDSNPEVLVNVRKPLLDKSWTSMFYTVFDDEISLDDTTYLAFPEIDSVDFDEYEPIVYMNNDKLYLDVSDLQFRTGLQPKDITLALITKHTTNGRGIPKGYHGRRYRKYKKNKSLYHTSNVYCGNPYETYDKNGNKKKITPFKFSYIYIGTDGQLLVNEKGKTPYNFIEYLMYKELSKQNFGRGRKTTTYLDYGFRAIRKSNKMKSAFRMSHRITYSNRIASYIETL